VKRYLDWKLVSVFLYAILTINPVVLLLLSKSIPISLGSSLAATTLLLIAYRAKRWMFLSLMNLFSVISIGVCAEAIFRINFPEYIIEDLYTIKDHFYFNKPYLDKIFQDKEYKIQYRTNKQGFRIGYSQPVDYEINECDWLFLGDSYTQGAQVSFENLFTSNLTKYFPDKIIINAGVSGFGIAEEFYMLRDIGQRLKPGKVFLQICNFNDFMNVGSPARGPIDYLMHYSDLARFVLFRWRFKQPGELPLGRWTEPFYPTEEENKDYNIFYRPASERKLADISDFGDFLGKIKGLTDNLHAELIVILVPTKEQIYFKYFEEVINNFKIDVSKLDMDLPNRLMKRLSDSLGIRLLDLSDQFIESQQEVFFHYDEHMNEAGHNMTASAIRKTFIPHEATAIRKLSIEDYGDRYPSFVDSGRILYQSPRNGNVQLFNADTSFRNVHRLTVDDINEYHPVVSPIKKLILFTEGDPNAWTTRIAIMTTDGRDRRLVTSHSNQYGAIPRFSSKGDRIAFAEWYYDSSKGRFTEPAIVITDLMGENRKVITVGYYENWRPVFSPDDSSLLYISKRNGNFDIFKFDFSTGTESRLTNTAYDEWDPNFSPDGRTIVYAGRKDGNWDLFEMDIHSLISVQLTHTKGEEWDPAYSLTGDQIIYGAEYGLSRGIYITRSELSKRANHSILLSEERH